LVAATNKHLKSLVVEKKFREDLFYRLNVITMNIPPLRERKDDIVPLSLYFIDSFNNKYGLHKYFNPSVLDILVNYSWPGNIRELENVIERAILTSDNENILEFSDIRLNLSTYEMEVRDNSITLTLKEFDILKYFLQRPKIVVSKDDLISKLWGFDSDIEHNNIEVYISFLRKKLSYIESNVKITTIRRVGYRLE